MKYVVSGLGHKASEDLKARESIFFFSVRQKPAQLRFNTMFQDT